MDVSKIDPNLRIVSVIEDNSIIFKEIRETEAVIYGLFEPYAEGPFRRLPADTAAKVSAGVESLALHTAGGRARFFTDSPCLAIKAVQKTKTLMPHMAFTGSSGFDLYMTEEKGEQYVGSFIPPIDRIDGFESVINFPDRKMRQLTLNFPLYDCVDKLYLGIKEGSSIWKPEKYRFSTPIVYYGSSITQGGCASRPGRSYQSIISRNISADHINLGFSGSAKGEKEMAEYISGLNMSVFVMDYDHNAPNAEYLENTHVNFFRIIRDKNPELPVILVSRPGTAIWPNLIERDALCRKVIEKTYANALAAGDRNVRYVDGDKFFDGFGRRDCTVDGAHPTDLGFQAMAGHLQPIIQDFLMRNKV